MNKKTEYLINLIREKLKNNHSKSIDIEKDEFVQFIEFLKKNS